MVFSVQLLKGKFLESCWESLVINKSKMKDTILGMNRSFAHCDEL